MAGLGETTAALAKLRRQRTSRTPPSTRGRLNEVDFGPNPGELKMLVHAPPGLPEGRPLIVVLHGCTQSAEQYADGAGWIDLAGRLGLGLVCPQQRTSNNPNRCFNWFEPGDIRRGEGEAASIRNMIEAAVMRFGSDRKQIFITGLSAGGAMASVMLATYPELFAGGGIIAGLPYGVASGMPQAFAAMFQDQSRPAAELGSLVRQASAHRGPWPRISVWQGSADATVKPSNADAIVRQWLDVHGLAFGSAVKGRAPGHHLWTRQGVPLVERRIVAGMGHGTPLATQGPDGVGQAGPFLLETGVSSSLELVSFWGIALRQDESQAKAFAPIGDHAAGNAPAPRQPTGSRAEPPRDAHDKHGVGAIINRALRAAGLMK